MFKWIRQYNYYRKYTKWRDTPEFSYKDEEYIKNKSSNWENAEDHNDAYFVYEKINNIFNVLKWMGIVIVGLFVFSLLIGGFVYPFELAGCNAQAVSFQHYYNFWGGCMVKYNNMWLPLDSVIQVLK